MAFAEIIKAGLDNPECAFFVGAWTGQFTTIRLGVYIFALFIIYKLVDNLALIPLIKYIKNKFKK